MNSPGEGASWLRTNKGMAGCIAVVCAILLIYLLDQDWVFDKQRDGFYLGFFSLAGASAMLICAIATMFDRQKDAVTPEMAAAQPRFVLHALFALAILGVYFVLAWDAHFSQDWLRVILDAIPLTGEFVLWTPIFLAFGMYLLGVRPWTSAIVAGIVVGLIIFGLFRLIGITLPSNFLLS